MPPQSSSTIPSRLGTLLVTAAVLLVVGMVGAMVWSTVQDSADQSHAVQSDDGLAVEDVDVDAPLFVENTAPQAAVSPEIAENEPEEPTDLQSDLLIDGNQAAVQSLEPVSKDSRAVVQLEPIDLELIDELILQGKYSDVEQILSEGIDASRGLNRARIVLRQAWCLEMLGQRNDALRTYLSIGREFPDTLASDVATLATARVMLEQGDHHSASNMLMQLFLARQATWDAQLAGDCLHTLARALAKPIIDAHSGLLTQADTWFVPEFSVTDEQMLKAVQAISVHVPDRSDRSWDVQGLTSEPEGYFVSTRGRGKSIQQSLLELFNKLGWTYKMSTDVRASLNGRTVDVDCAHVPADILLSCMLSPRGIQWAHHDGTISIDFDQLHAHDSQFTPRCFEPQFAQRFLEFAISSSPEHPATAHSYLLRGVLLAASQDTEVAQFTWQSALDQFPRSAVQSATVFNLGKLKLASGQFDEALKEFYRTFDMASGPYSDLVASLYLGRLLLENDAPRDAIALLRQGETLADETAYEGQMALLLAAAHLINQDPVAANQALLKHHEAFTNWHPEIDADSQKQLKAQAAFLSSLARWKSSQGKQREREGRSLIASLAKIEPAEVFGKHIYHLLADGFRCVGLTDQMQRITGESLRTHYSFPLQVRTKLLQHERFVSKPQQTAESELVLELIEMLTAAEHQFRSNQTEQSIATCHEVLKRSEHVVESKEAAKHIPEFKRQALQLIGKAYQRQGQHELAIPYFLGEASSQETSLQESVE